MYEPREDSELLRKYVKKYASGSVLDLGTGSGIQALEAANKKNVTKVLAIDIDKKVIDYCKKNIKNKKIKFLVSNLFSNIKGKFDTIIFNPPYLPELKNKKEIDISGGKKGYGIIERFLKQVKKYLKPNGIILVVFSSLTNKNKIDSLINENKLKFQELEKISFFFEKIYCYKLTETFIK